jgi:hypothetical protein
LSKEYCNGFKAISLQENELTDFVRVLGRVGAVCLKKLGFVYRFTKDSNVDPAEVSKNHTF